MSIRVALNHKTTYQYDRFVSLTPHVIRLRPAPHCRTPIVAYSLKVLPEVHFLNWQQDAYSNYLGRLVFPKPSNVLSIEVDLIADLNVINPFDFFLEESVEEYPFKYDDVISKELIPYLETEPASPRLLAFVEGLRKCCVRTQDYLVEINQRLRDAISYTIRLEPGIQTCDETLALASGSCRDTAWLLVQCLRHLGLAARFVSGYLIQLKPDLEALDGPSGTAVDFTDLHAWSEVYIPGAGWIGLDPTSGLLAGEGHIPLACAADPLSAAPISGSYSWTKDPSKGEEDKCEPVFGFAMSVTRIHEDPRVTKPYTDDQWTAIDALGHQVDQRLALGDVRLTMGGEPTFISIDDPDGPEWKTTALGGTKRLLGGQLLTRLRGKFSTGALLHYGQGKWYPGESLPRWALSCYWRTDGVNLWNNHALIADEGRDYGHNAETARQFVEGLASRLGVAPSLCMPAYEDSWYFLWKERQIPTNIDPMSAKLDDHEERRLLASVLDYGLGSVVGYVLPLSRTALGDGWISSPWYLRREQLYLIPGDSPIGFRLPMDSIPWAAPADLNPVIERDPFAHRDPLRVERIEASARATSTEDASPGVLGAVMGMSASAVVRTALCIEPRHGRLHIFMPPQSDLESYLELIACIEATAGELATPVVIEGYQPPNDPRLNQLSVTPDPGVIEVNLHPASSWDELVSQSTILYEEARQTRLGTEKFMLDGRHTGTGGGNHIVIGGPSAADSPILRRPDLLRSLIAYWHNHPSLSYLFSGMFVGPTSQAPRLDEARNDSLYEMEIAFRQIPDYGGCPPWLVDRVFRNLLVDVTGNTHRAEFCIDKLYSPDSTSGRRGLVEMRAFEMPPHARMSLVQQLLIRSLIARFWDKPYLAKLAIWGTELHDRFLLPHFVQQDINDVVDELGWAGIPMKREWFTPHLEFRFPLYGEVAPVGVSIQLRQAIEPWHVMGEEPGAGGAVRYVDSSLERVEIKVRGMTDKRHIITCNGRQVPLYPTGAIGEFVAGVRYRAWQPPSCLHPTIPSHAPLVFDLIDTWQGRSMGGFTYNVAHPGGLSYENFPINAYEAEGRRMSRFVPFGHTPGPISVPVEEKNNETPLTLDLRRPLPRNGQSIWLGGA